MFQVDQAARLLGVSEPMVQRWVNEGVLRSLQSAGEVDLAGWNAVVELKQRRAAAGRAATALVAAAKYDPTAARRVAIARAAAALRLAERER